MTDDLLQAVRDLPRVSRYLHVPAQSGCDEILKRMKRMYTVASYEEMLARIRETSRASRSRATSSSASAARPRSRSSGRSGWWSGPDSRTASSSSTAPRRGPRPTASIPDDVPEDVKKRRNNDLLAVQTAISREDNRRWFGRTVEVLVEGPSRSAIDGGREGFGQFTGRTACDRIVVFEGPERLVGRMVPAWSRRTQRA